MAKKNKPQSVFGETLRTPTGRLVFPNIARPSSFDEKNKKTYSAQLVLNPGPETDKIIAEINKVGKEAFGEDWVKEPKMYKPFVSGEDVLKKIQKKAGEKGASASTTELYTGRIRLITKGAEDKDPPKCYLQDKSLLPRRPGNEDDLKQIEHIFYAGALVQIALTPFSFDTGANQGVGLIFKGIRFIKDAPRLGAADIDAVFAEGGDDDGGWADDNSGWAGADALESMEVDEANL